MKAKISEFSFCYHCNKTIIRRKDNRSDRQDYKTFCSSECYYQSKKMGKCVDCGSDKLIKHEMPSFPIKICAGCLFKRRGAARETRVKSWRDEYEKENRIRCQKCGEKIRTPARMLKKYEGLFVCRECRGGRAKNYKCKRFKFCEFCGRIFYDKTKRSVGKCCSNRCAANNRDFGGFIYKVKWGFCQDCGCKINSSNKGHKSTGYVCKECMYIRKRRYKDKIIYGEDNLKSINKIRLIEASGSAFEQITHGEVKKCRSPKRLDWKKIVDQLKNSRP